MAKTRVGGTRLRPGDVLSVTVADQKWLLCYCGRDSSLGDTVWVRSGAVPPDDALDCTLFSGEGYYAFYPVTAALRQRLVTREGFCPEGIRLLPPLRRISSPFNREGENSTWKIAADARVGTPFTLTDRLTREEARIPEAAIWNHAYLIDKLQAGWHPADEGADADER